MDGALGLGIYKIKGDGVRVLLLYHARVDFLNGTGDLGQPKNMNFSNLMLMI